MKKFFIGLLAITMVLTTSLLLLNTGTPQPVSQQTVGDDNAEQEKTQFNLPEDGYIEGEFNGHRVYVVGDDLPEGATLSLSEVDMKSAQTLVEKMHKKEAVFACDIKVIDAKGKEWQPDDSVEVIVGDLDLKDSLMVGMLHLDGELEQTAVAENPESLLEDFTNVNNLDGDYASFETRSFSTFVGYTVDFHYGGVTHSIKGETSILLSDLFKELNIDKDATAAYDVTFSDESLVTVSRQENGDWLLTSLKAFLTEEELTVYFDGDVLLIDVTDAVYSTATITSGTVTTGKGGYNRARWRVTAGKCSICNGKCKSGTWHSFNRNLIFKGTSTLTMYDGAIHMNGRFDVYGTLNIVPGSWTSTSHAFRKMNGKYNDDDDTSTQVYREELIRVQDGAHLYVKGTSTKEIVFSGDMSSTGNDRHNAYKALIELGTEQDAPGNCSFTYTKFMDAMDIEGYDGHETGMAVAGISVDGHGGSSTNLTFTNCTFENLGKRGTQTNGRDSKRLLSAGSAIHVDNGCRLNDIKISKCTFKNCDANIGGAIRLANDDKTDSSAFTQNLSIYDSTFTGCDGHSGGAISFDGTIKEQVVISGCKFTSCKAGSGGAIYLAPNLECDLLKGLKLTGGTIIDNCDTDKDYTPSNSGCEDRPAIGGAIAAYYRSSEKNHSLAQLICDSVTIKNCNANDGLYGGAIRWDFTTSQSTVTLNSGCKIQNNSASGTGGAIYMYKNKLYIKGATISSNTSTNAGGGIRARSGCTVSMSSGEISSNKTNSSSGGGIYLDASTTFNLSGGSIKSNKTVAASKDGGGVYTAGTMTMTGGTITNNTATANGGGISTTGTLTVKGGSITSNKANNGGGIRGAGNSSKITIQYVETTAGAADTNKLDISTVPTISSNSASNAGGAIYSNNYLFVNGGVFKSNTATYYGGAIYVVQNASGSNNALNMNGAVAGMTENSKKKTGSDRTIFVSGNTAKIGGGIAVRGNSTTKVQAHISEVEISKNKATGNDDNKGYTIGDNDVHSGGGGGGIWLANVKPYGSDGSIILTTVKLHDNTSPKALGGGLFAYGCSKIRMESVSIYSNVSGTVGATNAAEGQRGGGGVYLYSTAAELASGEIYGNTAAGSGGGVVVEKGATFSMTSSSAKIGRSGAPNIGQQGGGIFCKNGRLSTTAGYIQYNEAIGGNGGGVYFYGDEDADTASIESTNISYNKAKSFGGAIAIFGGAVTVKQGTEISYNESINQGGGGIFIRKESDNILSRLQVNGTMADLTKIHHNKAKNDGGGIMATIYGEKRAEVSFSEVDVYNNECGKAGGGIYVKGCIPDSTYNDKKTSSTTYSTRFSDSTTITRYSNVGLYNNKAGTYGGGIFLDGDNHNFRGTKIYNNTANVGGGVCVFKNDSGYVSTAVALTTHDTAYPTSVYNNTATTMGGGVYVGCDQTNQQTASTAILYVDGVSIKNNKAQDGGGIAVQSVKVPSGYITGQAFLHRQPTTKVISAIENNTAENGGGGGIFVTDGADVYDFGAYIRYNRATGTNDATKAWNQRTTAGIGGGVYVSSGFENKSNNTNYAYRKYSSDYTEGVKPDSNGKYEFGLYRNEASFAADDLYATGIKTNINAPDSAELKLLNYDGVSDGWYEDFANGDKSYGITNGSTTVNDTVVTTKGIKYNTKASRYNASIHTQVSGFDSSKSYVAYIDGGSETVKAGQDNRYVALTYGIKSAGFLTVKKNVVDSEGNNLNDADDTKYLFQIWKITGENSKSSLSSEEVGKVLCDITRADGTILENQTLASGGKFTLGAGESIFIQNLPYVNDYDLCVREIVSGENYCYKVGKTENKCYKEGSTDTPLTGEVETAGMTIKNGARFVADFTNTMNDIEVNIKFYNRDYVKITNGEPIGENGKPADIASTPTVYTKSYFPNDSFANMITKTAVEANNLAGLVNNILDEYYCYTSQAQAVDATNSEFHFDQYGKEITDTTQAEKWVTFRDVNGNVITDYSSEEDLHKKKVDSITVWLRNEPKKYKYTVYQANSFDDVNMLDEGKYIADPASGNKLATVNSNNSTNIAYYNQRFDKAGATQASNETTNYLENYGLKPWLNSVPNTAEEIVDDDGNTYYFSYWAFDRAGEHVASTEIKYPYRVTNDLTLYAVYETEPNKTVGLSVDKNAIDVYGEGSTQKTVLNTMMNPYNCTVNDTNILDVGVIYVIDSKGNATEGALNLNTPYVDPDYVPEKTLYFVPDSNWKSGGARFAAYLTKMVEVETEDAEGNVTTNFVTEESKWVDFTDEDGDGIYECVIEDGKWTNVTFCQMNGTENIYANIVKQTGILNLDAANCYTITTPSGDWSTDETIASGSIGFIPNMWADSNSILAVRYSKETEVEVKYDIDDATGEILLDANGKPIEATADDTTYTAVTETRVEYNWAGMSENNGKYICVPPTGFTELSFCLMKDSQLSDESIISQTEEFTIGDDNCYTINQVGEWLTYTKTKTFYFTPDVDWTVDGASFKAHFTKVNDIRTVVTPLNEETIGDELWADLTDENGDGIYECTVPNNGWTNVEFCQMIDGQVNDQSESIVINSSDDLFTANSYAGEWSSTPITNYSLVPGTPWNDADTRFVARFSYVAEVEELHQKEDENGNFLFDENGDPIMETVVVEKHFYSDFLEMTDTNNDGKLDVAVPAVAEGTLAWTHITFYQMNGADNIDENILSQTDDLLLGQGDCYTITQDTQYEQETDESGVTTTVIANNATGTWSSPEITALKFVPGNVWTGEYIAAHFTIVTETQGEQLKDEDGNLVVDEEGNPVYETIENTSYSDYIALTDSDGDGILDVVIPDNARRVTFYQMDGNGFTKDNIVRKTDEFDLGSNDIITLTNRSGEWSTYVPPTEDVYTNLDKIRDVIKAKLTAKISANNTNSGALTLDLSDELKSLGIARGNCRVYYVANGNVLTNRNRVQFSEKFSTESLKNRRIYAFAAMYYAGDVNEWIVSDNCIDYRFDENGVEYISDDTVEPDTGEDQTITE